MQDSIKAVLDELLKVTNVASALDVELPVPVQHAIAKVADAIKVIDADEPAVMADVMSLLGVVKGAAPEVQAAVESVMSLISKPAAVEHGA